MKFISPKSGYNLQFIICNLLFTFHTVSLAAYRSPVCARAGMAATPHPLATEASVQILDKGGNAVDAALAAAFALSVVEQYHSGLGGGEFAVVWSAKDEKAYALDARECAPAGASAEMYLDPETQNPLPDKSWRGGLAVGVPGSVAGRVELHRRFGKLPFKEILQPAVKLARAGFPLDRYYADRLNGQRDRFANDSNIVRVFFRRNRPLEPGEILVQTALASTLEQIALDAGQAFYRGKQAAHIVAAVNKSGGIITKQDLTDYKTIWREPVKFTYRGIEGWSMPPPSSGGVCIALALNILEGYPLNYIENYSSEYYHLLASTFERVFIDRAEWLADPDFVPQPIGGMTSKLYADSLRKGIDKQFHIPPKSAGDPWLYEPINTSHISVIDHAGNMCAITTSVNTAFGSLVFVPELGIFLNNTMDDFATAPSAANQFDLASGEVNGITSGKRPLSSMSPTVLLKDGRPFLCLGSVGGPRIITSVVQMIVNIVDFGVDIQAAIDAPRLHCQWKPDALYVESAISPDIISNLILRKWNVVKEKTWSLSQGVMFDTEKSLFYGASDARGVGTAGGSAMIDSR